MPLLAVAPAPTPCRPDPCLQRVLQAAEGRWALLHPHPSAPGAGAACASWRDPACASDSTLGQLCRLHKRDSCMARGSVLAQHPVRLPSCPPPNCARPTPHPPPTPVLCFKSPFPWAAALPNSACRAWPLLSTAQQGWLHAAHPAAELSCNCCLKVAQPARHPTRCRPCFASWTRSRSACSAASGRAVPSRSWPSARLKGTRRCAASGGEGSGHLLRAACRRAGSCCVTARRARCRGAPR